LTFNAWEKTGEKKKGNERRIDAKIQKRIQKRKRPEVAREAN